MQKTFIISFQKSGTYLISEILENLGYKKTLIHIDRFLGNVHQVYKEQKLIQGDEVFKRIDFELSPEKIFNNLNDSYFAVGHIYFSPKAKKMLKNHKIILTKRNIKTSMISMMNFLEEKKRMTESDLNTWYLKKDPREKFYYFLRLRGLGFISNCNNILPWINENLLTVKFENITDSAKNTEEVKKISEYLKIKTENYKKILEISFEKNTVTKSSKNSDLNNYWSQSSEILFEQIGGNILNKKLGYS